MRKRGMQDHELHRAGMLKPAIRVRPFPCGDSTDGLLFFHRLADPEHMPIRLPHVHLTHVPGVIARGEVTSIPCALHRAFVYRTQFVRGCVGFLKRSRRRAHERFIGRLFESNPLSASRFPLARKAQARYL